MNRQNARHAAVNSDLAFQWRGGQIDEPPKRETRQTENSAPVQLRPAEPVDLGFQEPASGRSQVGLVRLRLAAFAFWRFERWNTRVVIESCS